VFVAERGIGFLDYIVVEAIIFCLACRNVITQATPSAWVIEVKA